MSKDRAAYKEMVSQTHTDVVPQIQVDGTMVIGYDEGRLRQLLNLEGAKY